MTSNVSHVASDSKIPTAFHHGGNSLNICRVSSPLKPRSIQAGGSWSKNRNCGGTMFIHFGCWDTNQVYMKHSRWRSRSCCCFKEIIRKTCQIGFNLQSTHHPWGLGDVGDVSQLLFFSQVAPLNTSTLSPNVTCLRADCDQNVWSLWPVVLPLRSISRVPSK